MKSPKELAEEVLEGFKSCDFSYDAKIYVIAYALLKLEKEKKVTKSSYIKGLLTEIKALNAHKSELVAALKACQRAVHHPALTYVGMVSEAQRICFEALTKVTGDK